MGLCVICIVGILCHRKHVAWCHASAVIRLSAGALQNNVVNDKAVGSRLSQVY